MCAAAGSQSGCCYFLGQGRLISAGTRQYLDCNKWTPKIALAIQPLEDNQGNGEKCAPHFWGSSARFSADAILPSIPTALPPLSRTGNCILWHGYVSDQP